MKGRFVIGIAGVMLVAAVLIVSMTESGAQVPVADGKLILLTSSDGNQDTVVVYHRQNSAFLVYGHTPEGLSLVKIRKLDADFELAGLVDEVPYSRKGYSPSFVKKELARLKKMLAASAPSGPARTRPARKGP
jgi:hypothetical protein